MTIRAKFRAWSVQQEKSSNGEVYQETVKMSAVYSEDKTSENYQFWQATPSGELTMYINNPGAFGLFKQEEEYYLDFSPVNKG